MFKSIDLRLLTQANNKTGTAGAEPGGQHVAPRAARLANQMLLLHAKMVRTDILLVPAWTIKAAVAGVKHPKFQERPVRVIQKAAEARRRCASFTPRRSIPVQAARLRGAETFSSRRIQATGNASHIFKRNTLPRSDDAISCDGPMAFNRLSQHITASTPLEEDSRHKRHRSGMCAVPHHKHKNQRTMYSPSK